MTHLTRYSMTRFWSISTRTLFLRVQKALMWVIYRWSPCSLIKAETFLIKEFRFSKFFFFFSQDIPIPGSRAVAILLVPTIIWVVPMFRAVRRIAPPPLFTLTPPCLAWGLNPPSVGSRDPYFKQSKVILWLISCT